MTFLLCRGLSVTLLTLPLAAMAPAGAALADSAVPQGYPAAYAATLDAAKAQGKLLIYTNLSGDNLDPVVAAFRTAHPDIAVEALELGPSEAFERYRAESGSGVATADLLIVSSVSDWLNASQQGLVAPYVSPEAGALPEWSRPLPGVYTFSADPMVTIWNSATVPEDQRKTAMLDYLAAIPANPALFDGKVATYDGRFAFGGAINHAFVARHGDAAWTLFEKAGPMTRPGGGAGGMVEKTASGEVNSAFFVSGPVVFSRLAEMGGLIAWAFPSDGVPIVPRGMGIPAKAPHPEAAQVFVDFVLSPAGQAAVASGKLTPYRAGVEAPGDLAFSVDEVAAAVGGADKLMVVGYDPAWLTEFDAFTQRWGAAFKMKD